MADPKLDFSDWFSIIMGAIATGVVAGLGSAMGWFRNSKKELHDKIHLVEEDMKSWQELHADHNTQLAVIQTCQTNTRDRLDEIGETTKDTNKSLKDLSQTVTDLLVALQAKK